MLVNHWVVYDFLKFSDVTPEIFDANKELRKGVPGARTKRRQDRESKEKEKQKS